jgi:hypothetical protein
MDLKRVKDYVFRQLGSSTVNVEIEDKDFDALIYETLNKLRPYGTGVRYVQTSGKIVDLSNHNPIAINKVWNASDIGYNAIQTYVFGSSGLLVWDANFVQRFELMKAYQMLWNEIQYQKSENFKLIGNTLYLDGYYSNILIEMTVNIQDLSDIPDKSRYSSWVCEYTLALAKEMIGRKRGKVTLEGSPIQLDSAQLLSEAQSEKLNLENQLVGPFMVY